MSPLSAFSYVFNPSFSTVFSPIDKVYYGLLLHSPRVLLYQGAETYVIFSLVAYPEQEGGSVLVSSSTAEKVKVQLVQKGWRAGIFGWNAAAYMGAKTKTGWEITPQGTASWNDASSQSQVDYEDKDVNERPAEINEDSKSTSTTQQTKHIATRRKENIDKEVKNLSGGKGKVIGTYKCRVPVASGDGYFRLFVSMPTISLP